MSAEHAAVFRAELDEMKRKPFEMIPIFAQSLRALADLVLPPGGGSPAGRNLHPSRGGRRHSMQGCPTRLPGDTGREVHTL